MDTLTIVKYNADLSQDIKLHKNSVFRLDQLKGKVQIISYSAKTVPEALKTRPILDLESYAVVVSLHSLQRFVSGVKVTLLTDSRVLFYLFSSTVHNSSVKIKRWCLKIIYDFPYIVLRFVRTTEIALFQLFFVIVDSQITGSVVIVFLLP